MQSLHMSQFRARLYAPRLSKYKYLYININKL